MVIKADLHATKSPSVIIYENFQFLLLPNCLIDDDGAKVVVYGGWVRNGPVVGELWILDVVALYGS